MSDRLNVGVFPGGINLGPGPVALLSGSVDPSVGSGISATVGSFYLRTIGQIWIKTGALDTGWELSTNAKAILTWGNDSIAASIDTRFLAPGRSTATATTTDLASMPSPVTGVLKNFYVRHHSAVGNGNSVVYAVVVNGLPTAITATLATGVIAQASDLSNAVVVTQGDRISIRAVKVLALGNGGLNVQASLGIF